MFKIKRFKVFESERMFGVGDIDYIENFAELFTLFSNLRSHDLVDKHGILKVSIDEVGEQLPDFDDLFDTEAEYYDMLSVIKDIIDKYYKKI